MTLRVTPTDTSTVSPTVTATGSDDLAEAMRAALERKQGKGPGPANGKGKAARNGNQRGRNGQVVVNRGAWKPGHR